MTPARRLLYFALVCAAALLSGAQGTKASDWPPVNPADLALKDNPKQPGSDGMILYLEDVIDAKHASYDGDSDEEYVRIKVFTQAGTKYGSVEIPYVRNHGEAPGEVTADLIDIKDIRGRTIHPDGTIVNFDGQVLQKELEDAGGSKYLAKVFNLSDVQPGSIIEYRYRRQGSPRYANSTFWTISREMFVREAHFSYAPIVPRNPMQGVPSAFFRSYGLPQGSAPQLRVDGSYVLEVHDVPAVVREPMMPPERILEARVNFYYRPIGDPSSETTQEFWSRMTKRWNGQLEHFIDKKAILAQEVSRIVAPSDSPETKLRKIYARVQQIRNLNEEGARTAQARKEENIVPNENVEDVLNHGYGIGRDLNFLFIGLARTSGLDANEVFLSQRNRELFTPETQDEHQLTANVVWVRAGSQEYYVDPASRYYPFGLIPWTETAAGGIRLNKSGADFVTTPTPLSTDAMRIRDLDLSISEDGSASGSLTVEFTGQEAAVARQQQRNQDSAGLKRSFEQLMQSSLPAGSSFEVLRIANWEDKDEPVHVEGSVKIPSFANSASHVLLAPVDPFQVLETRSFAAETRVNAIYFRYPYESIDHLKLHAPAGYRFAHVPPNQEIKLGAASYGISATQQGDTLEVTRHLVVNGVLFSKDTYAAFRNFFGNVKTDDAARISLQNAQSASNN
jgi:hypothetical protein